jgi:hypothetical protein
MTYEQAQQETIASRRADFEARQRARFRRRRFDPERMRRQEAEGEFKRKYLADRKRRRAKNIRDNIRRERIARRKAYVKEYLRQLYKIRKEIAVGVTGGMLLAELVREFTNWIHKIDEEDFLEGEADEIEKDLEEDLKDLKLDDILKPDNSKGINTGGLKPKKSFGTEDLFATSQGDFYHDEEQNIMVFVYRGTDFNRFLDRPDLALIDIINDLNMGVTEYMGLEVHSGFLKMFLESLDEVTEIINEFMNDETLVYVTGHSAGSVPSILLAYLINLHRGNTNAIVYTFGSPRGFIEGKTATRINKIVPHIFRVANDNDIVPFLPPRIEPNIIPQYIHVGTEYLFKSQALGGYGIEKGDFRTARNVGDILEKITIAMFLRSSANGYIMSDGSTLMGRLLEARKIITNPVEFIKDIRLSMQSILFYFDLIENPYVDSSRYNFRDSPQRRSRVNRANQERIINSIKAGFKNSWGDIIGDIFERSTETLEREAYETAGARLDESVFVSSRGTQTIKNRFLRAGVPLEAVNNYLTTIYKTAFDGAKEEFSTSMKNMFGNAVGEALAGTFGNFQNLFTALTDIGGATTIALVLYFFVSGQYQRFLGHTTYAYDQTLSALTGGKANLGHAIKSEEEILGDNDCSTAEGIFSKTSEKHFGRPVYESDGMRFTPHYHNGDIYMNHLPNIQNAIMGYYLYKPNEFDESSAVKGFVLY